MPQRQRFNSVSFFSVGVITTMSITLVLFLLGMTFLVGLTGRGFTSYLKENMGVSIELGDGMTDTRASEMRRSLEQNPYVKSVRYVSKDEIKEKLIEDLGRDPEEVLGYNPSNSYFDVFIKAQYVNSDSIGLVINSLKKYNLVTDVVYSTDDITQANSNLSKISSVLLVFAVILVLISFTLIRITIQLNIYSRRFIINTMRLVGATNGFIRKPFVWRMTCFGIIAAIIANVVITGIVYYFTQDYPDLLQIVKPEELIGVYVMVVLSGILLSVLATISAVNKYLRMATNKLYHA